MTTQAEIAVNQTKIMQAEHRPWISANPVGVVGVVEHTANGLQFSIGLYLKNTGHSPAKRASILIQASMKMFKTDAQKMICENANPLLKAFSLPIFPGDSVPEQMGTAVPEAEIVEQKERLTKLGMKEAEAETAGVAIYVSMCIAYEDMETDQVHHTPYDFILASATDKPGVMVLSGLLKQGATISQARLIQLPLGLPPD